MYKLAIIRLFILFVSTFLFLGLTGCHPAKTELKIAAGAGLTDALTEVNYLFMQKEKEIEVKAIFAAAGDLRTQIENGAPVDLFFSAASSHIDALESQGMIVPGMRKDILKNRLVLITHQDNLSPVKSFEDLLKKEVGLIAMGDPAFVPAGNYGLRTFEALEIPYELLQEKIILGNNVRQVLSYVESKNVEYGIVYYTDTLISESVRVVATAPEIVNEAIVFPIAIISTTKHLEAARAYLEFLSGKEARDVFSRYGYEIIN